MLLLDILYMPPTILVIIFQYMKIEENNIEKIKKSKYNETPGPLKLKSFIDAVNGSSFTIVG